MNHRIKIAERKLQQRLFETATKRIICKQQAQLKTIMEHLTNEDKSEMIRTELDGWF